MGTYGTNYKIHLGLIIKIQDNVAEADIFFIIL